MKEAFQILSQRLADKDLLPVEVSRLMKDVVNITGDGGGYTMALVNQKLETLGWGRQVLDQFTFELLRILIENEYIIKRVKPALHQSAGYQ